MLRWLAVWVDFWAVSSLQWRARIDSDSRGDVAETRGGVLGTQGGALGTQGGALGTQGGALGFVVVPFQGGNRSAFARRRRVSELQYVD